MTQPLLPHVPRLVKFQFTLLLVQPLLRICKWYMLLLRLLLGLCLVHTSLVSLHGHLKAVAVDRLRIRFAALCTRHVAVLVADRFGWRGDVSARPFIVVIKLSSPTSENLINHAAIMQTGGTGKSCLVSVKVIRSV